MRFNVLGPLTVQADDGSPVPVTRRSQRATLAVLLLQAAGLAAPGRLTDAIWGDDPPAGAEAALRVRIRELRRALPGSGRIRTGPAGYQIVVAGGELDAGDFRVLAARGRAALDSGDPRAAARYLGEACGLWREPPLADVPDTPPVRAVTLALLDQRREAGEWLVDARLRLGHHYELVGQIRAAVAADPLCEHQHVQLMLALYRCGHKTAALDAYSRLRDMTAREFGLDPGPEAQEMLRRILADTEDLQFMPRLLASRPGAASRGA